MQLVELRQNLRDEHASIQEKALTLRRITDLLAGNKSLSNLIARHLGANASPTPDADESAFLEANDVSTGRHFNDALIPAFHLDDTTSQHHARSTPLPDSLDDATGSNAPPDAEVIAVTIEPSSDDPTATDSTTQPTLLVAPNSDTDEAVPITYSQKASQEPDGPVALPGQIAPPQPEDEAEFSAETQELLDLESPQKPAKVVHLPPEDVEEERRREMAEARQTRSQDREHAKASRTHLQTQTDPASSPSSTGGALSAATPLPQQDSPDTSPDSENAEQNEVLPPKDMRPSPEEQREKEEHDRILAAQKEIARRQALGDVSTADEQLRWEERAAAARDAEERAAREDKNGPEADAKDESEETGAEEVMEGVERDRAEEQLESAVSKQDLEAVTEPSATEERMEPPAPQEDGDNITVTPRNKFPLSIDTSRSQQAVVDAAAQSTPGEQERMTTRTSSGALQKRSVSEILGQTPSRREVLSPETISPLMARHPHDIPTGGLSTSPSFQTPRRTTRQLSTTKTLNTSQSALDELNVLKGAAEDPDRDYLEPLFRIQAHDSPNVRTTSLPDLIRTASKTLSTEDQFSTLHERLDYRILRRIYQLQNANKWSLRQMEKCKEPEQPVTHHDYMMAEMQWMRKDFRAERKMKKSVCAWLAQRCAEWVAASAEERMDMQVQVRPPSEKTSVEEDVEEAPELDMSGESPVDDEAGPQTPRDGVAIPMNLIVPPELSETVTSLQRSGKLGKALEGVPLAELPDLVEKTNIKTFLTPVSKFVGGKVLPKLHGPPRKRSRFEYEDEAEMPDNEPTTKRLREERDLPPEDEEIALFHPDNKVVRNRLHQNTAFRPPSEFVMPSTQFYEFRNGSQWLAEDDKKLRDLAKEYSFNWSLIADELQLPGVFKTSAERRTPWECFERWVELEQLPTEMKKTMYFKTWYQRLEQSQQASERRYQAQVAALQAASNGQATHVPMRRRTIPTRVDKRKNTRYLWLVDAMRKLARKKEQKAYKEAESHRAAAQRKTQNENNQPRAQMLTPQEFSKKRYERDLQIQEAQRQHRQKMMEAQQRQMMAARQAAQQQQQQQQQAQGMQNASSNQQRPGSSSNMAAQQAQMQPNGQQQAQMNGQMAQQARPNVPMATRNGHLTVPPVNAQGIPQAQMRANGQMPNPQESMQRMAQANAQQARNAQYVGGGVQQQQYPMPSANMMSPGAGGMSAQQIQQSSQAMLASMQQQMNNVVHQGNHQMSGASPNMPPPPAPQQNHPQQLSSGHVPALLNIKANIRNKFPTYTEDQINQMATEMLKTQSQSSSQARQSAMNAAAGISNLQQAYAHNQAAFQNHQQMPNGNNGFMNGDGSGQQRTGMSPASPQQYAALLRQRQMQQMQQQQQQQQSPNASHASLNTMNSGSPGVAHASPSLQPVSPSMQFAGMNQQMMGQQMQGQQQGQGQRPPSRTGTPQMPPRMGSAGNLSGGLPPSPSQGMQGGGMQANLAR